MISPVIAEHRLMACRKLRRGALRVEVALCGKRLQTSLHFQALPLDLLIELLLLQLRPDERVVVKVAAAFEIFAKQIQIWADRGRWRIGSKWLGRRR